MTAFYVLGSILAVWAVIVAALGITRHEFPGGRRGERIVSGISLLLVAGALGSAIVSASLQEDEEAEAGEAAGGVPPTKEGPGGGGQGGPSSGPGAQIRLSADPGGLLKFDRDSLRGSVGPATIVMANPSSIPHNVSLEGNGEEQEGETVGKGGTSEVSAELKTGTYTFYCSVPGHRQGGMEGKLTVQ